MYGGAAARDDSGTGPDVDPIETSLPPRHAAKTAAEVTGRLDSAGVFVSGLSWRPHGRRAPTLRELTLTLAPGERVLLAGASGSGKSTLLRLLAGLADESLGELTGELRTPGGDRPGGAGLLLQDPTHAVVAEHAGRDVAFGPENRRADRPEIAARTEAALAAVGFPYPAARRSSDLSGGELQRLALAGALALDPDLLLLDEPTAMIDPAGAATVREAVIGGVGDRLVTVVIVDHRPGDWLDFCDRMIVLAPDGRLLADGPARTVLAERRDELLTAGVWVPGEPPPEPVRLRWSAGPAGTPRGPAGTAGTGPTGPNRVGAPSAEVAAAEVGPTAGDSADTDRAGSARVGTGAEQVDSEGIDPAGKGGPEDVPAGTGRADADSTTTRPADADLPGSGSIDTGPEMDDPEGTDPAGMGGPEGVPAGTRLADADSTRMSPADVDLPGSGSMDTGPEEVDPEGTDPAGGTDGGWNVPAGTRLADADSTTMRPAHADPPGSWSIDADRVVHEPALDGESRTCDGSLSADVVYRVRDLAFDAPLRSGQHGDRAGGRLVDGLDLTLHRGELIAVRGRSGSGKSTLLRVLAGLLPSTSGELVVRVPSDTDDHRARSRRRGHRAGLVPLSRLARRSRELARVVAWQPQHAEQQLTRRTVESEVLATSEAVFADDAAGLAAARRRAESMLVALGLDRLRGADPYQLSGGEQRRVALAAAVAHRPDVVLLDEPTVGQDRQTWAAVAGVIEALRADGTAVVVATHDHDLAARADRRIELGRDASGRVERPDYRIRPVIEPGEPPTARCNPAALLLIALGAAIGSFFVDHWLVGLLTLVLTAVLAPLAVRGLRSTLARLVPVTLAALTVGWSALAFSDRGFLAAQSWPVAAAEITRIGCLVIPGVLLIPSLPPSRLGDALAQRCRLPHRPVVAVSAGLLRLQQLLDVWRTMTDVRRIRGLDPGRSPVGRARHAAGLTFALLVYALRSAQELALSMDARGFAGARKRTFALPSPWRGVDWIGVGVATLLVATPIVLGLLIN